MNRTKVKEQVLCSKGLGQLTLVEHALCPLAVGGPSGVPISHRSSFQFVDSKGTRQRANATITAPFGMFPSDEFFLWGLLGLTFAESDPSPELYATPHFILRRLGCIDAKSDRGGSAYRAFGDSLRRLSAVKYHCDGFYDPVRREHRVAAFGFLSYSLPVDPHSSRAWRLLWDPLFFEYCQSTGGGLLFNLTIYRELDSASRRLYLFLSKIFWRRSWTHWLDLRGLAIDVLGFSSSIAVRNLKQKVKRAILRLTEFGIIDVPGNISTRELFVERDDGGSVLRLRRGSSFRKAASKFAREPLATLAICEPLRAIGLDDQAIGWLADKFSHKLIQQWADITLAAKERHGATFFKKSPQAYLVDNLRHAAAGNRTPPDWWWASKREEEQRINSPIAGTLVATCEKTMPANNKPFLDYLKGNGRPEFEGLLQETFNDLRRGGMEPKQAHTTATKLCVDHLRRRFQQSKSA